MEIFVRILNPLLMIALPLGLAVYLVRKLKVEWKLFGLGAIIFVGSQVLHIPFNTWVLKPLLDRAGITFGQPGLMLVTLAFLYGLSAGLFEEIARYFGFHLWLKEERNWKDSLMYGAGHGGIESILLGAITFYAFFQLTSLRGIDLSTIVPSEQLALAQAQVNAYWNATWYESFFGALERAATICFHISASVLVLQAFTRHNKLWIVAAVAWHTLLDAFAVYGVQSWGIYITEGIIVLAGILSVVLTFILRPPTVDEADTPPHRDQPEIQIERIEPDLENIEDSRYV
jgi:uncharacterized membrane protein YhfC